MGVVSAGILLIGVSSVLEKGVKADLVKASYDAAKLEKPDLPELEKSKPTYELAALVLVVVGQLFTAGQMVIQEKILSKYDTPPMKAVGYEGVFGFLTLSVLIVIFYFIPTTDSVLFYDVFCPTGQVENMLDAAIQMWNKPTIILAFLGLIGSIAVFNYVGMTITKVMSATHRMVLDTVRTIFIWMFSCMFGWEEFEWRSGQFWTQMLGFFLLVWGTMIYNNLMTITGVAYPTAEDEAPEDDKTPKGIEMASMDVTVKMAG
eukprot:842364_1